ncbi:MAG TPA: ATP synthase F1 subunit delta [Pyrinomonadaceae bacterium]|nr:ATP synthase F1 subunit delta [Pyrinomonadaceae bacterium]
MSSLTVARRYAVALADVAIANGEERAVQEELIGWEKMIDSSPMLKEVFANPTVPYEQKRKLLEELIERTKLRNTTANFFRVLLKNQRLTDLSEIIKRFAFVLDERSGVVAAEVTTARQVPEEAKRLLLEKLKSVTGREVRLTFDTDEAVIGGIVTRIGSTVYDGSVRTQLEEIRVKLADG